MNPGKGVNLEPQELMADQVNGVNQGYQDHRGPPDLQGLQGQEVNQD